MRILNEPSFINNIADKGVRNLDDARRYLLEGPLASYQKFGFGLWRIGLKENDAPIGMAGLLKRDFLENIDLGYALLPEFCGVGYAFEAASAIMEYASKRLDARRVVAIVNEDNESSIKLLGKLGFNRDVKVQLPGTKEEVRLYVSVV